MVVLTKTILENYKNIWLSSWANKFREINSLKTFIIYNLLSISSELLSSGVELISRTANQRQSSKLSSQILYKVLHSNLEKFTDKIPKSTIRGKIGSTWSAGEINDHMRHIIDLGFRGLMLILTIHSHVGHVFVIFLAVLTLHSFLGNKLKHQFKIDYDTYKRLPRRAMSC